MFTELLPSLDALLARRSMTMHMQPIPSVRRQAFVGVEALCRGIAPDGSLIAPKVLFEAAHEQGRVPELEALCHQLAVERFMPLVAQQPDLILFLNVSRSTIRLASDGKDVVWEVAHRYGIDPRNIAIEIPEGELDDLPVLQRSIERYNDAGFLVALDDIGVKQSNLDRIIAVQPDVLKLDSSLLRMIHRDGHKQEIFKAMVRLSERIGGWVIAEGIEQEDEALVALELGGDLMQGFYFGRPGSFDAGARQQTLERLDIVARRFKARTIEGFLQRRDARAARLVCAEEAARSVAAVAADAFDERLDEIVRRFPLVQSACVLDAAGVQISETLWRTEDVVPQKTVIFHPPTRGTDHALKEYVFLLEQSETGIYESAPYVPLPTSTLCITISHRVRDADGMMRILCLHMDAERFEQ